MCLAAGAKRQCEINQHHHHARPYQSRSHKFMRCQHSVSNSLGQSDLEVSFSDTEDQVWRVLIENKIYAGYQPEQAERYASRGELYKRQHLCSNFITVLTAPAKYIGSARNGFDSSITLENIRIWFENAKSLGLRQTCKSGCPERRDT